MISPVKIWRNQKHYRNLAGKRGTILSWTLIRVPPDGFADQAPYPLAIVLLEDKIKIIAQVVDWKPEELRRNQKVQTVIRRTIATSADGVIPYGIKVKPI